MPPEDRSSAAHLLEKKIAEHLRGESERKKALSEARYDVEGETLRTTSWTHAAKGYHQKESICEFKIDPDLNSSKPRHETRPKKMAKMARDYHNSIQHRDLPDEYGRMMATEITVEKCNVRLSENEFKEMDKDLF
jgi:hypothetical protein